MSVSALHYEVLDVPRKSLLDRMDPLGTSFYLAGGTALALQIGHRISYDFDLFRSGPVASVHIAALASLTSIVTTLVHSEDEFTCLTENDIRVSLVSYPFPLDAYLISPAGPLRLLSPLGITLTKAYALNRRATWRDYVDLYFLFRSGITLRDVAAQAPKVYGGAFSMKLFLSQLTYMDDIDPVDIRSTTLLREHLSPETARSFFLDVVTAYTRGTDG